MFATVMLTDETSVLKSFQITFDRYETALLITWTLEHSIQSCSCVTGSRTKNPMYSQPIFGTSNMAGQ